MIPDSLAGTRMFNLSVSQQIVENNMTAQRERSLLGIVLIISLGLVFLIHTIQVLPAFGVAHAHGLKSDQLLAATNTFIGTAISPDSGEFLSTAPLHQSSGTATLLRSGKLLVVGGWLSSGSGSTAT